MPPTPATLDYARPTAIHPPPRGVVVAQRFVSEVLPPILTMTMLLFLGLVVALTAGVTGAGRAVYAACHASRRTANLFTG